MLNTTVMSPDAESYATLAYADAYHDKRANTAWALLTIGAREAALRRATDYMVQVYRLRWKGTRATDSQALDWPRYGVEREDAPDARIYDETTIPKEVLEACALLALRAAAGELAPDVARVTRSEKVGDIAVDYMPGTPNTQYRAVDNLLAPLLRGLSGAVKAVSRA